MLFNLKSKKKKNFFKRVSIGALGVPVFDPLLLPNYQAGFFMNLTTDIPPGSIDPNVVLRKWYDMKTLAPFAKQFNRNSNTNLTLVNGYKAQNLVVAADYFQDLYTDIILGLTDFCFVIGFKRNTLATTFQYLFWGADQGSTIRAALGISPAGQLQSLISDWVSNALATTVNRYDDNNYHCAVVVMDQTNKLTRLYTDLGENVSATNVLLPAPRPFNYTSINRCQLGYYQTVATAFAPGVIGDAIFLNSIPSLSVINGLMQWECNRLNIPYVIF